MNTLKDVEIDEISLVDEPANTGSRIILFKRSSAVDRARAALEGVKKSLQAANGKGEGDTLPATVADCDEAFKALVRQFGNDPIKAMDSREGKALMQQRYRLVNRLDRIEEAPTEAEQAWAARMEELKTTKQVDRFLASIVAEETARTGKPRNAVYNELLKQPIGLAIYERRAELARAAA